MNLPHGEKHKIYLIFIGLVFVEVKKEFKFSEVLIYFNIKFKVV